MVNISELKPLQRVDLSVNVGEYGRNSDGRMLKESSFGKALFSAHLRLPEPTPLPGEDVNKLFPFYFVADEAFPLTNNVMNPYARSQLTNENRISIIGYLEVEGQLNVPLAC